MLPASADDSRERPEAGFFKVCVVVVVGWEGGSRGQKLEIAAARVRKCS